MRASAVVKRQSTRIASWLRCCCHAATSRRRTLWSGRNREGPEKADKIRREPGGQNPRTDRFV